MLNKKVNFFERCEEIKKASKRSVSTIYGEFAQIRFYELYKPYEAQYSKQKDNGDQYQKERAEMIAFGCLSCYEEYERCLCQKSPEKKVKFDRLTEFAQDLAMEKSVMKVSLVNALGQTKKMLAFHK